MTYAINVRVGMVFGEGHGDRHLTRWIAD